MSAHVLLNLLNELGGKAIKCEASRAFYRFFTTSLRNSLIQEQWEHKCSNSTYHMTFKLFCISHQD